MVPVPVHVPGLAVSTSPSRGVPATEGCLVLVGPAAAADPSPSPAATAARARTEAAVAAASIRFMENLPDADGRRRAHPSFPGHVAPSEPLPLGTPAA